MRRTVLFPDPERPLMIVNFMAQTASIIVYKIDAPESGARLLLGHYSYVIKVFIVVRVAQREAQILIEKETGDLA